LSPPPGLVIEPVPLGDADVTALIAALDADLAERYAADVDLEGEPDYAMLNILGDDVAPPKGALLLARLDGEPVGCGAVRPHADGAAEVKRMYVVPAARGRGVARAILRALEAAATDLGYRRLVLETGIRQQEAMALYESEGWTLIPNFGAYRESSLSRSFAKSLPLPPS
jgi:GNAT superfamily N-acetyltransferase